MKDSIFSIMVYWICRWNTYCWGGQSVVSGTALSLKFSTNSRTRSFTISMIVELSVWSRCKNVLTTPALSPISCLIGHRKRLTQGNNLRMYKNHLCNSSNPDINRQQCNDSFSPWFVLNSSVLIFFPFIDSMRTYSLHRIYDGWIKSTIPSKIISQ